MITDIASTSQCSGWPMMCCQISTDKPNDVPSESNTVPTITAAATTARVMISMMMKIRHSEAMPAIIRSYLDASAMSLKVAAVPAR
ncbi:hypothetical protein BN977_03864 [Mycolicibacterium cosmeticum]|uniref:Uncharacterized protein n=1 Tax=Mycolicibacterium cosmeticum TaxID=258533 RepID=W9ATE4_MYCCO|nr:hypothetical protein BN977_03864 [Mycolicibacterium cosmeticum]